MSHDGMLIKRYRSEYLELSSRRICPAIGRFEQAHLLQPEVIAIAILIGRIEYAECGEREIFRRWRRIQHDCFVVFQRLEKLQ